MRCIPAATFNNLVPDDAESDVTDSDDERSGSESDDLDDVDVYCGGDGAHEGEHEDTEAACVPNNEIAMMEPTVTDGDCDTVQRERFIECECDAKARLSCICCNVYVEVAAGTSTDTRRRYKAVLKRYSKDDKLRKREKAVHLLVDSQHARNQPLTEWGPKKTIGLLAMAFPHLFPYGLTHFVQNEREFTWEEGQFRKWLSRLPFLMYTMVVSHAFHDSR